MVLHKIVNDKDISIKENHLWQIIILSSLKEINSVNLEQLKQLVQDENTDWDRLFTILTEQKIRPLITNNLIKYVGDFLPLNIKEILNHKVKKTTFFHFNKIRQLKNALALLKENSIEVIPWKGALLAEELYGSFNLRQSGDIDLIVKQEHLIKSKSIFLKAGYIPLWRMSEEQEKLYISNRHSYELIKDGCSDVEIHWRLAKEQYLLNLSMVEFWENTEERIFYGIPIQYPTKEYLLLGLVIHHGGVECWLKYKLIVDFYYLLQKYPNLDWNKILSLSNQLGIRRVVLVGICLCHYLFDTKIPPQLSAYIRKKELSITKEILINLLDGTVVKQSSLLIRIREGWTRRAMVFFKIFFTPSLMDIYTKQSKGNYYNLIFSRPMRLVRKFLIKENDSIELLYSNRNKINIK